MFANSEGSGETARIRRLAWAFAGRLCDQYHNLMNWLILYNLAILYWALWMKLLYQVQKTDSYANPPEYLLTNKQVILLQSCWCIVYQVQKPDSRANPLEYLSMNK